MTEKVTFLASFPSVMSAIKVTGDGTGMRIILDIPESEMAEAVKLMLYRQVALRITVEIDEQKKPETQPAANGGNAASRTLKRSTARR